MVTGISYAQVCQKMALVFLLLNKVVRKEDLFYLVNKQDS